MNVKQIVLEDQIVTPNVYVIVRSVYLPPPEFRVHKSYPFDRTSCTDYPPHLEIHSIWKTREEAEYILDNIISTYPKARIHEAPIGSLIPFIDFELTEGEESIRECQFAEKHEEAFRLERMRKIQKWLPVALILDITIIGATLYWVLHALQII